MKIFKLLAPKKSVLISLNLSEATMIEAMLRSPECYRWADGNTLQQFLKSVLTGFKEDDSSLTLEEQIILHLASAPEGLSAAQLRQLLAVAIDKIAPLLNSLQETGVIVPENDGRPEPPIYRLADDLAAMNALDSATSCGTLTEQLESKILETLKQYPKQPKGFLAHRAGVKPMTLEPALQNLLQREEIIAERKSHYALYSLSSDEAAEEDVDPSQPEAASNGSAKPRKKKRSKRPLVDRETAKRMRKEVYPCVELWCERLRVQSFAMSRLIAWIPWLSPYTAEQVCSADPRLAIYEGKYVGLK